MRETQRYQLRFCKMSGAGNDFILINAASARFVPDPSDLAIALCPRRTSVGADGLILVAPSERKDADVCVRFWNPDGGETETCGNGTRCAARFAFSEGLAPEEMMIETKGSDIAARLSGELVTLRYAVNPNLTSDLAVTGAEGTRTAHLVEVGVPHLVVQVASLPDGPIKPICRPLRFAPELGDAGANVNLVEIVDRHRIRIRTYERGVEEETLACGSGSMSAAIALCATGQIDSPVQAETRSGDVLTVHFQRNADGSFSQLELEGPARIIYWGELADSDLPALS
ncbi:MAG: diaminopimelate epimerase [Gemmatimonadota bacterium]|nr:MAG: diaminopimelate epimerase [Gemmatimonadota bacterium]